MFILAFFALLSGVVTILSPCILPILPIVLSSSLTGGRKRPIGIIIGFITSFTLATLFLTILVKATGLSADTLRTISVGILMFFGATLLFPGFQKFSEQIFSRLASSVPTQNNFDRSDIVTGFLIGLSLGIIWTPCVGPILAAIIALAATSTVTGQTILIMVSYAVGTSIPMLGIIYGGRNLLVKPTLLKNAADVQKIFGVIMIVTAIGIFFQLDRKFQTYILDKFPTYGTGLTRFEEFPIIQNALKTLKTQPTNTSYGTAPELTAGGKWFNTSAGSVQAPLTLASLRGKVVLVDFWTYTCINCIRTLPYLKSWYAKYKDMGLVIIGIHTPEFAFEHNAGNVMKAISDFGIEYPVMQDNDYATWNAYNNRYWPGKYLIDKQGIIRFTHFGEGNYDETERMIQTLLSEGGPAVSLPISNPGYNVYAQTPETYLGYNRLEFLSSPETVARDQPFSYTTPSNIPANTFALSGTWTIGVERAVPVQGSSLTLNFTAQQVFLVMRPSSGTAKVRVTLDGQPAGMNAGSDVANGVVTVITDRLYSLVKLQNPGQHILKLEFVNGNVELYAFTFG